MGVKFVCIAKFGSAADADFFCALLEAHGFDAFTVGAHLVNAAPFFGHIQRIRLEVPMDQADEATRFLRSQPAPSVAAHGEADENAEIEPAAETDVCPNCGQAMPPPPDARVYSRMAMAFAAGAAFSFFQGGRGHFALAAVSGLVLAACVGVYLLTRKPVWTCMYCVGEDSPGDKPS